MKTLCTMLRPDQIRGFIVLAASFMTQVVICAIPNTAGVYYIALTEKYPDYKEIIPWIGSLYISMLGLGSPLAGVVCNMFSCRTCVILSGILGLVGYSCSSLVTDVRLLFVTLSLLTGLAANFGYIGTITVLGYYFPKKTSMVTGVILTGTSIGLLIHPSLTRYLIEEIGLQGAFLLQAAIVFHTVIFGLLMVPSKMEKERRRNVRKNKTAIKNIMCGSCLNARSTLKDPSFVLFIASAPFFGLALASTLTFMPDYFKSRGASFEEAAFSASMQGLGNIISRGMVGFAAGDERIGGGILYLVLASISWFIGLFANSVGGMYAYGCLFGAYSGAILTLISIRTFEIAGIDRLVNSLSLVMFTLGCGSLFGAPMAGLIFRLTNEYIDLFTFASSMLSTAALLACASTMCSRPSSNDEENVKDPVKTVSRENSELSISKSAETIMTTDSVDTTF